VKRTSKQQVSSVAKKSVSFRYLTRVYIFALLSVALSFAHVGSAPASPLSDETSLRSPPSLSQVDRAELPSRDSVRGSRIRDLIQEVDHNCLPIVDPLAPFNPAFHSRAHHKLKETLETVQNSELGAWLVGVAADQGVVVCLDKTTNLEAHYRYHLRLIGLNAKLNAAGRVVFLAHELAHIPQHPKFSNDRRFSPMDMLLLQRMREAAAEAVATRVLWQLRDRNIPTPWREKLTTAYRDIAMEFAAEMAGNDHKDKELWATRAAFHQWFEAPWRTEIYDDLMLKTLSRITQDQAKQTPHSLQLSEEFLLDIANYAGQVFLIDGDGRTLIRDLRSRSLAERTRARLHEMTTAVRPMAQGAVLPSVKNKSLSAVSSNATTKQKP